MYNWHISMLQKFFEEEICIKTMSQKSNFLAGYRSNHTRYMH